MSGRRRIALLALWLLVAAAPAAGHPLAPALLSFEQTGEARYRVLWKTPLRGAGLAQLLPRLPERCRAVAPAVVAREARARVERLEVDCGAASLVGERFAVSGLDEAPGGALLQLSLDGRSETVRLSAASPAYRLPPRPGLLEVAGGFFALGVEHLLGGLDHVLFVVVLSLLVGLSRRLVWTLTAFTAGHSVTLALATLGWVRFPASLVEPLIALSIVLAAVSLIRRDAPDWLARRPGAAAGAFGLLHGMGFAGALAEVGLPADAIPLALAGFNLGIEAGQLLVVGAFAAMALMLRRLPTPAGLAPPLRTATGYALGVVAAAWLWQRLDALPGSLLGG